MYTLHGKIWSTRFSCSICAWSPTIHLTWSTYSNLSLVPTRSKQTPTPERSLGNQRQTDPVVALGHLILPPSWQPWSRGEKVRPSGYITTLAYWTHIPTCDRYVQYLLMEANPLALNWHRQRLQPWRCRFFTSHSSTFLTDGHPLFI
jgi:hypothetical protein